jgi:hypothetical protein
VPAVTRADILDGARSLPVPSGVGTEERSCSAALRVVKGEGRGRGRPCLGAWARPARLRQATFAGLVFVWLSWAAQAAN